LDFRGPTSKGRGRERKRGEGREGKGTEKRGWEGRKGKGRGGKERKGKKGGEGSWEGRGASPLLILQLNQW